MSKSLTLQNYNDDSKWVKFEEGTLTSKKIKIHFTDNANTEKEAINLVVRLGMYDKNNRIFGYAPDFVFMKCDGKLYSSETQTFSIPARAEKYTLEYMKNFGDSVKDVTIEWSFY